MAVAVHHIFCVCCATSIGAETMQSIVIPSLHLSVVKEMIPVGVEHYIFAEKETCYINIRTSDMDLLNKLAQVANSKNV
jgi:hypothetical protein